MRTSRPWPDGASPAPKRAKADIVKGLGLIVGSNEALAAQLKNKSSGHAVSKAAVRLAVKADLKGNLDLSAGLKLLKP